MDISCGKVWPPSHFRMSSPISRAIAGQNMFFGRAVLVCALQTTNVGPFSFSYLVWVLVMVRSGHLVIFVGPALYLGQLQGKTCFFLQGCACVRSADHKRRPFHFIFGMGTSYGKVWPPIDFRRSSPISRAIAGQKHVFFAGLCLCALCRPQT